MFSQGGVMFCGIKSVTWCYPACYFFSLGRKLTTSSGLLKLWTNMLSKLMVIVQHLILIILFHRMALWIILLWQSCMTTHCILPSAAVCFIGCSIAVTTPEKETMFWENLMLVGIWRKSGMWHWLFKGGEIRIFLGIYGTGAFCMSWLFPNIIFALLLMLSPLPISALHFLSRAC